MTRSVHTFHTLKCTFYLINTPYTYVVHIMTSKQLYVLLRLYKRKTFSEPEVVRDYTSYVTNMYPYKYICPNVQTHFFNVTNVLDYIRTLINTIMKSKKVYSRVHKECIFWQRIFTIFPFVSRDYKIWHGRCINCSKKINKMNNLYKHFLTQDVWLIVIRHRNCLRSVVDKIHSWLLENLPYLIKFIKW